MGWKPGKYEDYPSRAVEGRKKAEAQFVAALFKDPEVWPDYKIDPYKDFFSEESIHFYQLGQRMYDAGYRRFDAISVDMICEQDKDLRTWLSHYNGGFMAYEDFMSVVDESNIDAYYDAIIKSNLMCRLYDEFTKLKDDPCLSTMKSDELYDLINYKLGDIAISETRALTTENVSEGYGPWIEEWSKGKSVGIEIGFPILNYRLVGVHESNLLLWLGPIGGGKSSGVIPAFILPAIKKGEDVCLIVNEQNQDEWRQMLLSTVLFNEVHTNTRMTRHDLITGRFDEHEKENLLIAAKWLHDQPGKIYLTEMQDYSIHDVGKIVKKYSKLGIRLHILDTFKAEDEASPRAWADMSEAAKELFQIAKKEQVAMIATAQLSAESMRRKQLDLTCVGKSRAISETATQVVMFRPMADSEKEDLFVYRYKRQEDGTKVREQVLLDAEKSYVVLFTPKNRFGETTPQLVYERNMNWNRWKEIGYTEIPFEFG